MAHFALLWKARTIEKYRQKYEDEKIHSIIMSNACIRDKTLFQRWKHYSHDMHDRLSRTFSKWYPEGTTVSNFFVNLRTDMKLASILLRSLYGFVGGLLLTYLGFMFFVFQLSLSLMHATILSSVLGVVLTLGLTFSNRMRCIIFLLIPQLFSRVGRYTLTCYALVLILTGPATNTLKNSEVLSESMACRQEQIKLNVREINESIKKPFNSIKQSLKITIASMKLVVQKLKIALIRINRLILSIASEIQSGFSWLVSVADLCNKALGTPHEKCVDVLKDNLKKYEQYLNQVKGKYHKDSMKDSEKGELIHLNSVKDEENRRDKHKIMEDDRESDHKPNEVGQNSKKNVVGSVENKGNNDDKNLLLEATESNDERPWFSYARDVVKIACGSLKTFERFCVAADFTEDTFYATIRSKLRTFVQRLSDLLHLKLNIHYTYTYIGNTSSTNQVAAGIITEIRNRADPILTWLSWSSCVTSLFLLLIFFRAKHYQHMFETRSRFDNRFITKEFRELDLKRLQEGRETVLPLNRRERAKYVTTTSFRLVASEKLHLNRSAVFMTVATFKLLIHIVADYSLYWVLMTIHHHGKLQSPLQPGIADTGAFVSGSGFVSRLLQSFIETLNVQLSLPPPDQSCLPNPNPPDFKRYSQIGFLIFLLWFFALFEPYGLRLRHLIMGHHRPQRAKARALWLYNHILRTRASFMKFARRRLHREYKYSSQSSLTFRRWLQIHIPFCWLRSLLGVKPEEPHCLLCNISEDNSNPDTELIRCEVPNCPGTYCLSCFSDIGQLCTICLCPTDYGDISDVSLEKGSDENDSDDDDHNNSTSNNNRYYDRRSYSDGNSKDDGDDEDDDEDYDLRFNSISKNAGKKYSYSRNGNNSEMIPLSQDFNSANYGDGNEKLRSKENHALTFLQYELKNESKMNQTYFELLSNKQEMQKCYEQYVTIIDVNNNIIDFPLKASIIEVCQYSAYQITSQPFDVKKCESTTQFARYLRKNKIVRCKKIYVSNNIKYFMSCSDDSLELFKKEAKDNDGKLDRAKEANNWKNSKDKSGQNKDARKSKDDNQNNKYKQSKQNASKKRTPKNKDKNSKENAHNHSFKITKYWKNMKTTNSPHNHHLNTKRNLPPTIENKHKRKKKRKKSDVDEILVNSRLYAYLEDRDWIENPKQIDMGKNYIGEETGIKINEDQNFKFNDVIIPRLNLNLTSESDTHITLTRRKDYGRSAINRFFKSIVSKTSISFNPTKKSSFILDKHKKLDTDTSCNINDESHRGFHLVRKFSSIAPKQRLSKTLSLLKGVYSAMLIHSDTNNTGKTIEDKNEIVKPIEIQEEQIESKSRKILWNNNFFKISVKGIRNDKHTETRRDDICSPLKDVEEIPLTNNQPQIKLVDQLIPNEEVQISENNYLNVTVTPARYDKGVQTLTHSNKTEDKAVAVYPLMKSCGFQSRLHSQRTHDYAVQVENTKSKTCQKTPTRTTVMPLSRRKPISQGYDKGTQSIYLPRQCTCALHKYKQPKSRNVGTCLSERRANKSVLRIEEVQTELTSSESSATTERSNSDTTICRVDNIYYRRRLQVGYNVKQHKRVGTNISNTNANGTSINRSKVRRYKVVTKANRSTLTDNTRQTDVSTATDWWSPIVEKKNISKSEDYKDKRENKKTDQKKDKGVKCGVLIGTGDKVVTFRSRALLIPDIKSECIGTNRVDVLSPMRYLLESQKYYNELFCSTPQVYPVINIQKRQNLDWDQSQSWNRHQTRRGRKTKRLEESYSPRKEVVRNPESSRRARKRKPRSQRGSTT